MAEAPHRDRREVLYRAVTLALDELPYRLGPGHAHLGGRFITHCASEPAVVVVGWLPKDWSDAVHHAALTHRGMSLLTMTGVAIYQPYAAGFSTLESVSTMVDTTMYKRWPLMHANLSHDRNDQDQAVDNSRIGYVEVI